PTNADAVYAGGVHLYRSLDAGATWSVVSRGETVVILHTEQHALGFAAASTALYVGNDGGAYRTEDRTATTLRWAQLNGTLAITQFPAAVSIHPADLNQAYGGT